MTAKHFVHATGEKCLHCCPRKSDSRLSVAAGGTSLDAFIYTLGFSETSRQWFSKKNILETVHDL